MLRRPGIAGRIALPYRPPMSDDWKTYAEAGAALGIKPESVKRRARAKHWPKIVGNDGLARVKIPDLPHTGEIRPDAPEDTPSLASPPNPPLGERLAAAETEIRLLRERLDDLTADRDALRDALARAAAARQVEPAPPSKAGNVEHRRGFFDRFLRR